ncbi:unnamed protein product, partial [Rotaria magnacalcarata]
SDLIAAALDQGYSLIDTAEFYNNERDVGVAIKQSSRRREDVFVISKWWPTSAGAKGVMDSLDNCLKQFAFNTFIFIFTFAIFSLESSYVDLYMIHAPKDGCCAEAYRALTQAKKEGKIK